MKRVKIPLSTVRDVLGISQSAIQHLKTKGELGEYSYAAYNDYAVDDVIAYLDRQIADQQKNLSSLKNGRRRCVREGQRALWALLADQERRNVDQV